MVALPALLLCSLAYAGDIVVDMLDIGQGDAILLRTPAQKTVLIDSGDRGDGVVDQLVGLGVDHLDLAVATHPHADHIGSMESVVRALPPKVYLDNGLPHSTSTYTGLMAAIEANPAITYKTATKGMVFNLDDGAKLEVLAPSEPAFHDTRSDLNSNSVVMRFTHGEDCILFVGDSEEPTERRLIDNGVGTCDVLKVAHHGSRHSTIQPFLDVVQPKYALISVGVGNRYHHPGPETIARLEASHVTIYRTDRDGRITLTSTGKGVVFATEKRDGANPLLTVSSVPGHDGAATPAPAAEGPGERRRLPGATGGGAPGRFPGRKAPLPGAANPPAEAPTPPSGPAPAADPDMAPDVLDDEACPFAASRRGEVYHLGSCGNAAKINPENLMCYESKEAAEAAGKRSAGCCHP